jgi:hypothetical protein
LNKIKLIFLALIAWTSIAEAAKDITKRRVIGLWSVVDFKIISKNGLERKWADETYGTLIYTQDNFMSVSINGKKNGEPLFLFYSGTYVVYKNNIIKHRVYNATDPNRVNKTMIRLASYHNGFLTLTAYGDYGSAIIKWKKINLK